MEINLNRGMPGMPQLPTQAPIVLIALGAALALFGIVVLFNPWLLVYLVAGVFILVGFVVLMMGLRLKRMLGG